MLVVISCVAFAIKNRIDYPDISTKPYKDFGGVMRFIGVCIFSMEGVGITLPIENAMAEPTLMPIVVAIGKNRKIGTLPVTWVYQFQKYTYI